MRVATALIVGVLISATTVVLPAQSHGVRERARVHYRIGLENLRAEAWAEAAKAFQEAVAVDSQFDLAYAGLGRANMGLKRYVEAIAAFSKCRDLYRAQAGRQFTNAQEAQRYRRDRIDEIDEMMRQYQSGPQTMQVQHALRQLGDQRRQLQESIQRGTNITIDSGVPAWVSLALGSAYFRAEKFADAEDAYKEAIAADPSTGEAHNNLAVVYLLTGRYRDAQRAVQAAERAGFRVNPKLKEDIREKAGSTEP